MDVETNLLVDTFKTYQSMMEMALYSTLPNPKNAKASEDLRKEGNVLFSKKSHSHEVHAEVLRLYNKSAAVAPSGSQELAFAYGNRSAFLLHIGRYQECILDIDKALEINKSDELKIKLSCRKVECLKNLGIPTYKDVLEETQGLVNKFDDANKNKKSIEEIVKRVVAISLTKKAKGIDQKSNKTINLAVTDNVLQKVSIKHDKKYGRHLLAKQKYNTGDIIFVEKLFSTSLKQEYHYTNCHHCLKICWAGIPCNNCDWAVFCSEDCRKIAWQEYHDVECSLGTLYKSVFGIPWYKIPCLGVTEIFIKAIKNAGSVENLRAQLKAVDQCPDICTKGFYKDDKFNSNTLESFYSLTKRKYTLSAVPKEITFLTQRVLIILIGLTKHSPITIFQVREVDNVIHNKDIMFLGSLLLKLTTIYLNNGFYFNHYLGHYEIALGIPQGAKGFCVGSLVSLVNNSCCPNTNICFTEDGKAIVYALQSIEENDQIFISYSRQYSTSYLEDRKEDFNKKYSFECDCQACVEAWPPVLLEKNKTMVGNPNFFDEAEFVQKCLGIWETIEKDKYHKKSVKIIVPKINQAFKTLKQPSIFTCMIQEVLSKCMTNIYNGLQPQFYGECKLLDGESKRITIAYYGSGP